MSKMRPNGTHSMTLDENRHNHYPSPLRDDEMLYPHQTWFGALSYNDSFHGTGLCVSGSLGSLRKLVISVT